MKCFQKSETSEIVGLEDYIYNLDDEVMDNLYKYLNENELFSLHEQENFGKRKFMVISEK